MMMKEKTCRRGQKGECRHSLEQQRCHVAARYGCRAQLQRAGSGMEGEYLQEGDERRQLMASLRSITEEHCSAQPMMECSCCYLLTDV